MWIGTSVQEDPIVYRATDSVRPVHTGGALGASTTGHGSKEDLEKSRSRSATIGTTAPDMLAWPYRGGAQ